MSSSVQTFEVRAVGRLANRVDDVAGKWEEMKNEERDEWWLRVMAPLLVSGALLRMEM